MGDVRVSNTTTRILDGFAGAVDDAAGEGTGGCDAGLDAARDEVVVWCHGCLRIPDWGDGNETALWVRIEERSWGIVQVLSKVLGLWIKMGDRRSGSGMFDVMAHERHGSRVAVVI